MIASMRPRNTAPAVAQPLDRPHLVGDLRELQRRDQPVRARERLPEVQLVRQLLARRHAVAGAEASTVLPCSAGSRLPP